MSKEEFDKKMTLPPYLKRKSLLWIFYKKIYFKFYIHYILKKLYNKIIISRKKILKRKKNNNNSNQKKNIFLINKKMEIKCIS
jgi:hypothetical protein